jgi:hypothetical protein
MKVENLNTPFYIVGNSSNLEKRRICDYIYIYIYIYLFIYLFQNISFMTMQNIQ